MLAGDAQRAGRRRNRRHELRHILQLEGALLAGKGQRVEGGLQLSWPNLQRVLQLETGLRDIQQI